MTDTITKWNYIQLLKNEVRRQKEGRRAPIKTCKCSRRYIPTPTSKKQCLICYRETFQVRT